MRSTPSQLKSHFLEFCFFEFTKNLQQLFIFGTYWANYTLLCNNHFLYFYLRVRERKWSLEEELKRSHQDFKIEIQDQEFVLSLLFNFLIVFIFDCGYLNFTSMSRIELCEFIGSILLLINYDFIYRLVLFFSFSFDIIGNSQLLSKVCIG